MSNRDSNATTPWGGLALASWVVTFAASWFGVAPWLSQTAEGVNDVPRTGPLLTLAALIVAVVLTVRWARSLGGAASEAPSGLGRRRFLAGGAGVLGGIVGTIGTFLARDYRWFTQTLGPIVNAEVEKTAATPLAHWQGARVREYRRLGRTNFEISDISLGSGRITGAPDGERLAREAIDRGINYFDTAPDYSKFGSEMVLGKAVKGVRDQMFIATKFCTGTGHLPTGSSVADYMGVIEASLGRLQTDYVDLVHIHSCNTLERLMDPNVHEAFDRLREQGKARFLGFSSHTPDLPLVANQAIESGRFDVMMLAYHHGSWPSLGEIIDRAHAADVGVVAMKTLKGAKHHGLAGFREHADSFTQAAFRWVLSNPKVAGLVVSFFEDQHLDEYLHASGTPLSGADVALLQRYDELIAGSYCEPHCGACLSSCPEELAINDVLRHRMYFEDYGQEKEAMRLYSQLEKQADVCAGCAAPCTGTCPYGIPIQERTAGAHELLTLG